MRVWGWFDQQTENGNAPSVSKKLLDRLVGVSGFCEHMKSVGWMVEEGASVYLPHFDRHNGRTAKNRVLTAKRVANHKAANAKGNDESNAAIVSDALPREEKRREEKNKDQEPPKSPEGKGTDKGTAKFDPITVKPSNVSAQVWAEWCAHRKELKKPLTEQGWQRQAKTLEDHHNPEAVIDLSIRNGWTGLFPEKVTYNVHRLPAKSSFTNIPPVNAEEIRAKTEENERLGVRRANF